LPRSAIATSQKSRCTSSPIALTLAPFVEITDDSGELWANDTDGSALAAQPGQSQEAATDSSGSNAHRRKRPAHAAFSRRPLEPSTRTVIPKPGRSPRPHFHAPISRVPRGHRSVREPAVVGRSWMARVAPSRWHWSGADLNAWRRGIAAARRASLMVSAEIPAVCRSQGAAPFADRDVSAPP
jgi:hypothetical protein